MVNGLAPLRDPEGFTHIKAASEFARRTSLEDFRRAHPAPGLLVLEVENARPPIVHEPTPAPERKERSYKRTVCSADDDALAGRYIGRLAFLEKRPGNPFPNIISIGRAMNNDIVLFLDTISKFQGYFTPGTPGWTFTDQRSSNGTRRNGKRLDPGKPVTLGDGDRLEFGLNIAMRYLEPESLWRQLRNEAAL